MSTRTLVQFSIAVVAICAPAIVEIAQAQAVGRLHVSIVDLIIRPESVGTQRIAVSGFLGKTPNLYLFSSEEHSELRDIAAAISVTAEGSLYNSACIGRFVTIKGEFTKHVSGEYKISQVEEILVASETGLLRACWNSETVESPGGSN